MIILLLFAKSASESGIQLLTQLGLSKTQSKIYFTLLELRETTAGGLSEEVGLPRSEVYRVIHELQQKGLVDREISYPNRFSAAPIEKGLQILLYRKASEYEDARKKIKEFEHKFPVGVDNISGHSDYKIKIINGKNRILDTKLSLHNKAQRAICILNTWSRWVQSFEYCLNKYIAALNKGVEYRIIIQRQSPPFVLPKKAQTS